MPRPLGFTENPKSALTSICEAHTRVQLSPTAAISRFKTFDSAFWTLTSFYNNIINPPCHVPWGPHSTENPKSACPRPEFMLHQRYRPKYIIKSRESLFSSPIRLIGDEDEDADDDVNGLMGRRLRPSKVSTTITPWRYKDKHVLKLSHSIAFYKKPTLPLHVVGPTFSCIIG